MPDEERIVSITTRLPRATCEWADTQPGGFEAFAHRVIEQAMGQDKVESALSLPGLVAEVSSALVDEFTKERLGREYLAILIMEAHMHALLREIFDLTQPTSETRASSLRDALLAEAGGDKKKSYHDALTSVLLGTIRFRDKLRANL